MAARTDAGADAGATATAQGPFFEELRVGQVFDSAPGLTLTSGHAATHQAILGDRLRLPLDEPLAREVTGGAAPAYPGLVWDVAIGQSTLATQHVKANLFYRGLAFRRFPVLGDTLRTSTEVVGLRQNSARPGRRPTGLAVLRIRTVDQRERPVLDFWRCAMLPLADPELATGHRDELDAFGAPPDPAELAAAVAGWRLDRYRDLVTGPHFVEFAPGWRCRVGGADVVSSAPELARLSLNIAAVHHDDAAGGGRRLVYGGHPIGLALAQVSRAIPSIVTVAGWRGCDHLAPVAEGDALSSTVTVEDTVPLPGGGGLLWLRVDTEARATPEGPGRAVLLWRCAVVLA